MTSPVSMFKAARRSTLPLRLYSWLRSCAGEAGLGARYTWTSGRTPTASRSARFISAVASSRSTQDRSTQEHVSHGGFQFVNAGLTAAIELADGSVVVFISTPTMPSSASRCSSSGSIHRRFSYNDREGSALTTHCLGRYAFDIVAVDTPGPTRQDFKTMPMRRRSRPLYPFELDTVHEAGSAQPAVHPERHAPTSFREDVRPTSWHPCHVLVAQAVRWRVRQGPTGGFFLQYSGCPGLLLRVLRCQDVVRLDTVARMLQHGFLFRNQL